MAEEVKKSTPSQTSLMRGQNKEVTKIETKPLKLPTPVKVEKPTFFQRLKETFIAEDARDVGDFIVWDILIPTVKRTLNDIICGAANRIFLGSTQPYSSNLYRDRGITRVRDRTAGASLVRGTMSSVTNYTSPSPNNRTSVNFNLNRSSFDDYSEATEVLDEMVNCLEANGFVTVNDYMVMAQYDSVPYTAEEWGWRNLRDASIDRNVRDGKWYIKLPRPQYLK